MWVPTLLLSFCSWLVISILVTINFFLRLYRRIFLFPKVNWQNAIQWNYSCSLYNQYKNYPVMAIENFAKVIFGARVEKYTYQCFRRDLNHPKFEWNLKRFLLTLILALKSSYHYPRVSSCINRSCNYH